ncbi:uncharacterized protein LOC133203955 [Saccostrea echinata]|uniref:uncharacterized protein LOC133203955 n=1 Tax=Saccostrea echinata TaxID=191078 RepID=UPI002A82AB31|nr:uncharacterized protein LOC133203955 [Saccostrea echinata]
MEDSFYLFVLVAFIITFEGNSYGETVVTNAKTTSNLTTDRVGDLKEILINQDLTQKLQLVQNVIQVMNDVQTLKNDVQRLETENSYFKQEFGNKTNIIQVASDVQTLEKDVQSLKTEYSYIKREFGNHLVSTRNESCTRTLECLDQKTHIAFYAYYSNNFKAPTTIGATLIFDSVVTNLGNGYNKRTGIFTTPLSGVYAFTWTLHAAGSNVARSSGNQYGEMNASIKQNGVTRGAIHVDTERKNDDAVATGFVLLSLKAGDEIQIVSDIFNGQGSMYSNDEHGRTSFSGFQIA